MSISGAAMIGKSSKNPIVIDSQPLMSGDEFDEDLQLQKVIISSLIDSRTPTGSRRNPIVIDESPESIDAGESSKSQSLCEICLESIDSDAIFPLKNCSHTFCKDCISRHVSIKVKERKIIGDGGSRVKRRKIGAGSAPIACPGDGCGGDLDTAACREVLPADIVSLWDEILCESTIAAAERFYCPFKNCSALLEDDGGGGGAIREAECPYCRRLFCASCKVPWHSGIGCKEFSKLGKDEREREDLMLLDLAKKKKWKRCSRCNFFVERQAGCEHMVCRCGYQFCYICGKAWTSNHHCRRKR